MSLSDAAASFRDAVEVLTGDTELGVPGTFTARGAAPISCRVVIWRHDPIIRVGRSGVQAPGWKARLDATVIPVQPKADDRLEILGGPWIGPYVVHMCKEDSFSPSWDVELGAVPA